MSYLSRDPIMTVLSELATLRRPQMLLRTARHGTGEYNRDTDLRRILRLPATPPPGVGALRRLMELEDLHNSLRTRPPHEVGNPWRAARHVEILIALIAEARLLTDITPQS